MNFLILKARAAADTQYQSNPYSLVIMLAIFILIFYFTVLRPQQKRVKIHKELMNSISKGDEILTTGGLIGRVVKVIDNGYVIIAFSESNEVIVKRDFITAILPRGTIKELQ